MAMEQVYARLTCLESQQRVHMQRVDEAMTNLQAGHENHAQETSALMHTLRAHIHHICSMQSTMHEEVQRINTQQAERMDRIAANITALISHLAQNDLPSYQCHQSPPPQHRTDHPRTPLSHGFPFEPPGPLPEADEGMPQKSMRRRSFGIQSPHDDFDEFAEFHKDTPVEPNLLATAVEPKVHSLTMYVVLCLRLDEEQPYLFNCMQDTLSRM
jgi:hypothetical protein